MCMNMCMYVKDTCIEHTCILMHACMQTKVNIYIHIQLKYQNQWLSAMKVTRCFLKTHVFNIHACIHTKVNTCIYTYVHTYIYTQVIDVAKSMVERGESDSLLPIDADMAPITAYRYACMHA